MGAKGDLLGFWLVLGHKHVEISGTGPKTEKRNFLSLGVPKTRKKVTALSGMVVHNFSTLCVLTDQTPRGGNRKLQGFYAPLA